MEMPRPGPAHEALAKLAGSWVGQEKIEPSPFDPQGGPATGRVNNRMAVGGWALVQDYEQTRNGQVSFTGHGVFSVDLAKNATVLHWYDSMAGGPFVYTGGWKGDVLALTGPSGDGQGRCTFDCAGGGYKFKLEVSPDGKEWFTFMSGTYKKA